MQSSFVFSLRGWRTQIPSLLIFQVFFKWHQIMDLDLLRPGFNARVLFADRIPIILLKHLDRSLMIIMVGPYLSVRWPEGNFEN